MEGLLISAVLRQMHLKEDLPTGGWVFPDEGSAALLLPLLGNLVLRYRPPNPLITLEPNPLEGEARTPFQRLLASRAKGVLQRVEQVKLDRVVQLWLAGEKGFLDTPPTRLVFELTGRNANLILVGPDERILGLDREVKAEVNRFRVLRPGLPYVAPPPYQKIDPRNTHLSELRAWLGKPVSAASQLIDGIGKELAKELSLRANLSPQTLVQEDHLAVLLNTLQNLVEHPAGQTEASANLRDAWEQEEAEALRKPLREALQKQARTLQARLEDYQRAIERIDDAARYRSYGDLLLAYAHQVPKDMELAQLEGFEGQLVSISLDRYLTVAQNADRYYQRAKRLEANAERALMLQSQTESALLELHNQMAQLEELSREALRGRVERSRSDHAPQVGLRLQSPGGLAVWVGRNAKENDLLTRSAHSQDLWFHVQGIPGSHVILRTSGKAPPLPDLIFAAQLAAFYSKAKGDLNVAVDYTQKKNVWRPRKAAAGQVLYSQAKTLFVDAKNPT